jgi:hypothetical protein
MGRFDDAALGNGRIWKRDGVCAFVGEAVELDGACAGSGGGEKEAGGLRPRVEPVAEKASSSGAPGGARGCGAKQIRELELALDDVADVRRQLRLIGTQGRWLLHRERFDAANNGSGVKATALHHGGKLYYI